MPLFKKAIDVDNLINKVASGADKLHFSNQERSEFNLKVADGLAEHAKDTLGESTERSRARRVISYVVIVNFFALFWLVVWLYFTNPELANKIKEFGEAWGLPTAFLIVLGFFFGSYLLRGTPLKK
jgi:hypothetical protein